MSDNSYAVLHDRGRKIVSLSADYLSRSAGAVKSLLLKHGACPGCSSTRVDFSPCGCSDDVDPESWTTAIADSQWLLVESSLEKDRLRMKAATGAAARKSKFTHSAGLHTAEDLDTIRSIQNDQCYFCEVPLANNQPNVDHLVPVADEGSQWPSNLAYTCGKCNRRKNSKTEREFWEVQKKTLGAEIVKALRQKRAAQRKLKVKLDRVRMASVKDSVSAFETALNAAVDPSLGIEIYAEFAAEGIELSTTLVNLLTAPCTHRHVQAWSKSDAKKWSDAICSLHALSATK